MLRRKIEKYFFCKMSAQKMLNYSKQQNLCLKLARESKKDLNSCC